MVGVKKPQNTEEEKDVAQQGSSDSRSLKPPLGIAQLQKISDSIILTDYKHIEGTEITTTDLHNNMRIYELFDSADRVTELCKGKSVDTDISGLSRKQLYAMVMSAKGPKLCAVERFLNRTCTISTVGCITESLPSIDKRLSILPNDSELARGFGWHKISSKRDGGMKDKWTLIMNTNHVIKYPQLYHNFFHKRSFNGCNYIIIEDVYKRQPTRKNRCGDFSIDRAHFSDNFSVNILPIARMPQQNHCVKNCNIAGVKKGLEDLTMDLSFDFRLLMFVLGSICSIYFSQGSVEYKHNEKSAIKICVSPNNRIIPGQLIYTKGCGTSDMELNTFCALINMCSVNEVVFLNDAIGSSAKVLTGFSFYVYVCKLAKNIMYTSHLFGCSTEHLWAFMAGMHNVLKIYGHSDEGGLMRTFLSKPVYPTCCGILHEAVCDHLYGNTDTQHDNHFTRRQLLDLLLFFPNIVPLSDTGFDFCGVKAPSFFKSPKFPGKTPHTFANLESSINMVCENMRILMAQVWKLESALENQSDIYANAIAHIKSDRHLSEPVVMPFLWLDSSISNFYGINVGMSREIATYYGTTRMPFLPKDTTIDYMFNERTELDPHDIMDITFKQHSIRHYGYGYLLNPRYNPLDGLGTMIVLDNKDIASEQFLNANFLFSNGDAILGKNKWTMPHCTLNNFYEALPTTEEYTVRYVACVSEYMPGPDILLSDQLDTLHYLTRLSVTALVPKINKHGKYINRVMLNVFNQKVVKMGMHKMATNTKSSSPITNRAVTTGEPLTQDTENAKSIGDNVTKINNAQKQANQMEIQKESENIKNSENYVSVKDCDDSNFTPETIKEMNIDDIPADLLTSLIEKNMLFTPSTTPVTSPIIQEGDQSADVLLSNIFTAERVAPVETFVLDEAELQWDDVVEANKQLKTYLAHSDTRFIINNQITSFAVAKDYVRVCPEHLTSIGAEFLDEASRMMDRHSIIPQQDTICIGYCGRKARPKAWHMRVCALRSGVVKGEPKTQMVIVQAIKEGSKKVVLQSQAIAGLVKL